jgi:retron-type reverse transcriptase
VLSVLSKILERIVHTRLPEFFATILTKHQYGFRKNLNTELALINFYQSLIDKLDKGFIGFGLFIDLKKAFDTVDHKILLRKLARYGVCGPVLSWFKDYLSGRTQCQNKW